MRIWNKFYCSLSILREFSSALFHMATCDRTG